MIARSGTKQSVADFSFFFPFVFRNPALRACVLRASVVVFTACVRRKTCLGHQGRRQATSTDTAYFEAEGEGVSRSFSFGCRTYCIERLLKL